jgi:hypothetical protein
MKEIKETWGTHLIRRKKDSVVLLESLRCFLPELVQQVADVAKEYRDIVWDETVGGQGR